MLCDLRQRTVIVAGPATVTTGGVRPLTGRRRAPVAPSSGGPFMSGRDLERYRGHIVVETEGVHVFVPVETGAAHEDVAAVIRALAPRAGRFDPWE